MFTLVIGGAASGKSEYAETLVQRLEGRRVYLATMECTDEECESRIEKHRLRRAQQDYLTIERTARISAAPLPEGANVLLECLSNLLANEMFSPVGAGGKDLWKEILELRGRCLHLTVVTNEVFSGGADYSEETLDYLRLLSESNRQLAQVADRVVEVVAGLPVFLKGEELP